MPVISTTETTDDEYARLVVLDAALSVAVARLAGGRARAGNGAQARIAAARAELPKLSSDKNAAESTLNLAMLAVLAGRVPVPDGAVVALVGHSITVTV